MNYIIITVALRVMEFNEKCVCKIPRATEEFPNDQSHERFRIERLYIANEIGTDLNRFTMFANNSQMKIN